MTEATSHHRHHRNPPGAVSYSIRCCVAGHPWRFGGWGGVGGRGKNEKRPNHWRTAVSGSKVKGSGQ